MASRTPSRLVALLAALLLAVAAVACDQDENVEEDPDDALRDAVMEFRDYEGIELVLGVQLDDEARSAALAEEDMDEDLLDVLTSSTLTVRAVAGEGDEEGEAEFVLTVGDEEVLQLRAPAETELYALIDLPAIERVADTFDAGDDFRQAMGEFQEMASFMGLGEVLQAAQDGEWIQVTGLEQMMSLVEQQDAEEPDEEDLAEMAGELGERLLSFLEDDEVDISHLGSDDAGERVRVTAAGPALRDLLVDVLGMLEDVAADADPTGMGMAPGDLQQELAQEIPDDIELSFDTWIEGGAISQVGVDVFELARGTGAEDVPEGEFFVLIGIADFAGPVEAPDAATTFDLFEILGGMMGGLGDDALTEEEFGELELDEGEAQPEEAPEDFCLSQEELDQILQSMPEDQRDLSDEEIEEMVGVPVC